jgi:endonuclease/exonuclease/phosphatase family metal-dependent hydrolase
MIIKTRINLLFTLIVAMLFACNQDKKESTDTDGTFRLITYNVWYGFTKVPERKDQWIRWMQEQDPDVVSLQELNEYTPEKLAEDAQSWGHTYSELLKTEGFPTGVTSKYPIEDVQRFFEGFHHGLLRVKIQGKYIYIIHLHPSNWETRNREIDWIISDIDNLPKGSPVILAGDFNTFSPDDSIYYAHKNLEPFFKARDEAFNEKNLREGQLDYSVIQKLLDYGLIDLENKKRTGNYQFTGSFPTLIEKEGEHGDQRRLDYVFTDGETATKVVHAEIIADDVTLKLSDHLPMIVDFEFVK